jgi:hypothetical protein
MTGQAIRRQRPMSHIRQTVVRASMAPEYVAAFA